MTLIQKKFTEKRVSTTKAITLKVEVQGLDLMKLVEVVEAVEQAFYKCFEKSELPVRTMALDIVLSTPLTRKTVAEDKTYES